jgi:MFS family permease
MVLCTRIENNASGKDDKMRTAALPGDMYALFAVRLVVSAGSFVGPFLAMMLTLRLGYDEARAGVFMSAVSVVSALGLFVGGKLGDRFNRSMVLRSLQLITAVAYGACGLIGFRPATPFVIAFAMGTLNGTWPIINALVADLAPPDRRKEAFSLLYWGNNIGFSIGPLVAGMLFVSAPRALFFGNALALVVALSIVTFFVRDTDRSLPPLKTAATAMPAASTLSVFRANPILSLYAAGAVLGAFVYGQQSFALPVFLNGAFGVEGGPKAYGTVMMVNGVTVVTMTAVVVLVSKRLRSLSAVAVSSLFYAVGFGSYWFVGGLPLAMIATFIWTIGEILGATNGNVFIAERSPETHRSRVNSVISFGYIVGSALAPLAAGPIAASRGSAAVWPFVAVCALVSAAYQFGIDRLDRRRRAGKHS